MRQPVSFAARRAFWPSRPIASDSIRSGTTTFAMRCSSSIVTPITWAGLNAFATNTAGSSCHGMTSIFSPPSSATTDWTRAPRWPTVAPTGSRPSWRVCDRDLGAAAGLARDRLDLDGASVDLRHLELEQAAQEALVGAADVDLRAARGAPDLEHVGLDVLADPVVLGGRLLGGREDRLHVLADVEDDRARLDAVHGAGDHLALAAGELVEDHVALRLTQPLQDDLLGGLGMDAPERLLVELLGLDEVADGRRGVVDLRVGRADLGQRILDLADHAPRAEDPDLARVSASMRTWMSSSPPDPAVRRLDGLFDSSDQLLARNLLLCVQLEEGADEIATHHAPPSSRFSGR